MPRTAFPGQSLIREGGPNLEIRPVLKSLGPPLQKSPPLGNASSHLGNQSTQLPLNVWDCSSKRPIRQHPAHCRHTLALATIFRAPFPWVQECSKLLKISSGKILQMDECDLLTHHNGVRLKLSWGKAAALRRLDKNQPKYPAIGNLSAAL
ncbi:hypothetical protein TNIN_365491 [Trichonephila inaurata madagascariensis]|uniref:Uncharacterized protein n=1 Tax=Trichonephila inaurata madagascariensis TaxID=2747483 RepID=A0A8X7BRU8_9ARAC|nr:hypothetical protein TNIN_365491 [Trichonephila inaurata madagascariensis]